MTSLPGGITGANLAGSAAGTQSRNSTTGQTRDAAAEQGLQVDRGEMSARSAGDVDQADHSADRDADGRLHHDGAAGLPDSGDDQLGADTGDADPPRPADAYGERGKALDLDA